MPITLPPPQPQHDQPNQNATRQEIMRRLNALDNRLRKVESA